MAKILQKNRCHLKRERNLLVCLVTLLIAYFVVLFFLEKTFRRQNWFFVALLFESAYLFTKAYFFKSDSSLYLGSFLFFLSVFGLASSNFQNSVVLLISYLLLSLALSHFMVYCFFKKHAHFFAFIFIFLLFLPMFLYSFNCINLPLMILSICGVFLFATLAGVFVIYGKIWYWKKWI